MAKVAFIGLGVMGYPMAGHLQARHQVTVYNRTAVRALKWVEQHGGAMAATPALAAENAEFIFCCVGNDDDLRQVVSGRDGILTAAKPQALIIDNTTTSANVAKELYDEARKLDIGFLDAPVSGGQAGAENGTLTVMAGGDEDDYVKAAPVIDCYSAKICYMGRPGNGQLTKMVNQICLAGAIQGLAEGINFAGKAGLDCDKVFNLLQTGAAGSWQMTNRHATMSAGEYDFGFAVDWMRKDLGICLAEARHNKASLPLTAIIDQFYAQLQELGDGHLDTSSLLKLLQKVDHKIGV